MCPQVWGTQCAMRPQVPYFTYIIPPGHPWRSPFACSALRLRHRHPAQIRVSPHWQDLCRHGDRDEAHILCVRANAVLLRELTSRRYTDRVVMRAMGAIPISRRNRWGTSDDSSVSRTLMRSADCCTCMCWRIMRHPMARIKTCSGRSSTLGRLHWARAS